MSGLAVGICDCFTVAPDGRRACRAQAYLCIHIMLFRSILFHERVLYIIFVLKHTQTQTPGPGQEQYLHEREGNRKNIFLCLQCTV